jgi:16S rRNA processing protein RimM
VRQPDARDLVIVGRLRRAHGVKGEMVTEVITDAPAEVFIAGRRLIAGTEKGDPSPDGAVLTITRAEPRFDGSWLLGFAEIRDRDVTARWRLKYLLAPRGELTPPEEGEVYLHELPGMRVVLESGDELGEVKEVVELPAGLALDVAWKRGMVLMPYVFVRSIDLSARRIVAAPPDGLFE